jgi:hypothetical protein
MESVIKSQEQTFKTNVKEATVSPFWESLEYNRYGLIPIILLIIGCIGGVAAAFGAGADIIKLSMVAFPTIISLAMILAVAPMRVIIYVCSIALALDLLVFAF